MKKFFTYLWVGVNLAGYAGETNHRVGFWLCSLLVWLHTDEQTSDDITFLLHPFLSAYIPSLNSVFVHLIVVEKKIQTFYFRYAVKQLQKTLQIRTSAATVRPGCLRELKNVCIKSLTETRKRAWRLPSHPPPGNGTYRVWETVAEARAR